MNHWILDIIFIVAGALIIFINAKRGLFLSLLKFCKLMLSISAAYLWGGALGKWIGSKLLYSPFRSLIYGKVNGVYLASTENFSAEAAQQAIPQFLLTDQVKEKLSSMEEGGEALVNSVTDSVAGGLSNVVGAVIGFVAVFLIAFLTLTVVYFLLKKLKKKFKLVGTVDTLFGALLGLVLTCILFFVASSIIKFFFGSTDTYTESVIVKFFGDATLLEGIRLFNINDWLNSILHG